MQFELFAATYTAKFCQQEVWRNIQALFRRSVYLSEQPQRTSNLKRPVTYIRQTNASCVQPITACITCHHTLSVVRNSSTDALNLPHEDFNNGTVLLPDKNHTVARSIGVIRDESTPLPMTSNTVAESSLGMKCCQINGGDTRQERAHSLDDFTLASGTLSATGLDAPRSRSALPLKFERGGYLVQISVKLAHTPHIAASTASTHAERKY
jgi:hypothetical protein